MKKTKKAESYITIHVTYEEARLLKDLATANGKKRGQYLTALVREYLEPYKKINKTSKENLLKEYAAIE